MKIVDLLSGYRTAITNEEQQFISRHTTNVKIHSLNDHDQWVAQNLVRKGVYSISNDNTLVKAVNESDS